MTSKQRAYLSSLANPIDPIFQIGKSSLTPEIIDAIGYEPLFGHKSGKKLGTNWMCFMKEELRDYQMSMNDI